MGGVTVTSCVDAGVASFTTAIREEVEVAEWPRSTLDRTSAKVSKVRREAWGFLTFTPSPRLFFLNSMA